MKIAFASDYAYPWFNGGIERRRYLIMKELASSGHEVHMFTMRYKGMPGKDFVYDGINYHCCGKAPDPEKMYVSGRRSAIAPLNYAMRIVFRMLGMKFHIIDADSFPFLHIVPLSIYARLTNARFIVSWHEVWNKAYWKKYMGPFGFLGYWMELYCAKSTNLIVSNSASTALDLRKTFKIKKKHITIFPAAISAKEISEHKQRVKRPRIIKRFLSVNRLIKEKRVDMAIHASASAKAKLKVIGIGEQSKVLQELATKLHAKVEFIPSLPRQELFDYISNSVALLMLSEREGLSLITLEALALETPVIIVKSTSLPEEVRKLCKEIDDKMLAKEMKKALKSPSRYRNQMSDASKSIMHMFSTKDAAKIYLDFSKK